jgi:hypothetical protein
VMSQGIVEHHHRHQTGRPFVRALVNKQSDGGAFDGYLAGFMLKLLAPKSKCTEDRAFAMRRGKDTARRWATSHAVPAAKRRIPFGQSRSYGTPHRDPSAST